VQAECGTTLTRGAFPTVGAVIDRAHFVHSGKTARS
jgi:hypothetical protein